MRDYLFDAYGTLFDLGALLDPVRSRVGPDAGQVLAQWRTLQLEYAWLAALQRKYRDFEEITRDALIDALAYRGINESRLIDDVMVGFMSAKAFSDVSDVLRDLRAQGCRCAILSNGTARMLQAAVRSAGFDDKLDTVISVDPARTYKPDPSAYALGASWLAASTAEIGFVSSNWWDIVGAGHFGFHTIWLNRTGASWPAVGQNFDREIGSLRELSGPATAAVIVQQPA
jgi:2-haloacid dehalogenase